MIKKSCWIFLLIISFIFVFQGIIWAVPDLPRHPDWYVDEEMSPFIEGWNQGWYICKPPTGGYNTLTEDQVILNSWGYKANPLSEIKDLLPESVFKIYNNERWGTVRVNETAWEPVKPRGAMWERFMKQSKKNIGTTYIDKFGWLRNYRYGIPFLEIEPDDPQAAVKCIWNYLKRYQDNDRFVPLYGSYIDRNCRHTLNGLLNRRIQMTGRVRPDDVTDEGLYTPNPSNLDFCYATPYVAPYNLRGTIPLYYRYNDPQKSDAMWIYIPSIRRVRRMSTAQHQDRLPGGADFTWDTTEGFEGNPARFNWVYLGRKELLIPTIGHSHCYYNPKAWINGMDQYYQRRNCHVIKGTYKHPINMTDLVLYLDPLFYSACFSVDYDLKGREWIVQFISQGRDKHWFYTMYNDWAFDIQRDHITGCLFAFSGAKDFRLSHFTMKNLMQDFLSR